jgi:hypothetical protein
VDSFAYRKGVNHGLVAEICLSSPDDLGDILVAKCLVGITHDDFFLDITHTRVIWFEQGNLDTFVVKEAFGLCKVQWGMVGRRVPERNQHVSNNVHIPIGYEKVNQESER